MEIAGFSVSSNICRIEENLRFRTTSLKGGIVYFEILRVRREDV